MATIKSYSDLQQSKKLAEILPLESADMVLPFRHPKNDEYIPGYVVSRNYMEVYNEMIKLPLMKKEDVCQLIQPAWSLAALYHILPNNEHISTTLSRGGWKIEPIEYLDNWWCEYEDESHTKDLTVSADNPVDACYEMILKLHKRKML